MQGRVAFKQGKIMLTSTPYSLNWLYFDFYENCRKQIPNYKLVQYRSIDSPYFPKEEFERVRTTMDRRTFERRYCGLFTKMEGLVYEDFSQGAHIAKEIPQSFEIVLGGIDWGFTAPAGIVIWGKYDGRYYLLDEFKQSSYTTPELIEKAKNLKEKWKVNRWYADAAEPDRIKEFNDAGLYVLEGDKSIVTGINKFRALIKDDRIRISPQCKAWIDEVESYHYPEKQDYNDEGEEVPEKHNDHLMDATRYIFSTYQPTLSLEGNRKELDFQRMLKEKRKKHHNEPLRMA